MIERQKNFFVIGDIHGKVGYHLGDEAMFISAIDYMARILPDYSLIVLAWSPDNVKSLYNVQTVLRYASHNKLKWFVVYIYFLLNIIFYKITKRWLIFPGFPTLEAIQAISRSSFILHTGSGTWNTAGESPWWLFDILIYLWCSSIMNIPVLIVSQSFGPFSGKSIQNRFVAWLAKKSLGLPNIKLITVRDQIWSFDFLRRIRRTHQTISYTLDDAIWLRPSSNIETDRFLNRYNINENTNFIIVSLSKILSDSTLLLFSNAFSQFLKKHSDYRLVFIPHVFPNTDIIVHRKLIEHISVDERAILVEEICEARLLKSICADAKAVVSSRYHGIVIGASVGLPGIAIIPNEEYRRKMLGLIDATKANNIFTIDINCEYDELVSLLDKIISLPRLKDLWFLTGEPRNQLHNQYLIQKTLIVNNIK